MVGDSTDPFGGDGNQSAFLHDNDNQTPRLIWNFDSISTGELSFDFFMPTRAGAAIGTNDTRYSWRLFLYTGSTPVITVGANAETFRFTNAGNTIDGEATIPFDQVHSFRITFEDQKYSIWINDTQLSYTPDGSTESISAFDWTGDGLNRLDITAGFSSAEHAQIYVDNVSLTSIPEPAHFALAAGALGLLSMMIFRKRLK